MPPSATREAHELGETEVSIPPLPPLIVHRVSLAWPRRICGAPRRSLAAESDVMA